ncbi:G-alpha-domain-containing protein [Nemania sp. FL0031]|nr:G-alpha-domain-containing protein [Nemania sp. FL0031]
MDPITIGQIIGSAVSLGNVVLKCIAGMRSLKQRYYDAPLVFSTIVGQLYMVHSALDQLAVWNKPEHALDLRYQQLARQIDNALECFSPLITALEKRLEESELISGNDMTTRERLAFLWNEQGTSNFSVLLDRQVNALNLLLQAIQCETLLQQQLLFLRADSQSILQDAKYCSSSIVGPKDSASLISENTNLISETTTRISMMFDFDHVILGSKVYQQAGRSHLRQAIRVHNQASARRQPENRSLEINSQLHQLHRQASPVYSSSGTPSLKTRTNVFDPQKTSGLQSITNVHSMRLAIQSQQSEEYTIASDSSQQKSDEPRNQGKTNHFVEPWRKPKTMTSVTGERHPEFLILGISESGKSTLLQGFKLALAGNYVQEERELFTKTIWSNAIQNIRDIVEVIEFHDFPLEGEDIKSHATTILMQHSMIDYAPSSKVVEAISALWLNEGFQSVYQRRSEYQFSDNTEYYTKEIKRIAAPHYVPTDEDMLWARWTTTGRTEEFYSGQALLCGDKYCFVDVGGMRSEREHWFQGIADVSVVLFTIDMTAYARKLYEDKTVNRMQEQLELFETIVGSREAYKSAFVLIFTKLDLIGGWLQREPVEKYFPDYPYRTRDAGLIECYTQYITDRFLSLARSSGIASRVHIVLGDLITGREDTISKILEAINLLVATYDALYYLRKRV